MPTFLNKIFSNLKIVFHKARVHSKNGRKYFYSFNWSDFFPKTTNNWNLLILTETRCILSYILQSQQHKNEACTDYNSFANNFCVRVVPLFSPLIVRNYHFNYHFHWHSVALFQSWPESHSKCTSFDQIFSKFVVYIK